VPANHLFTINAPMHDVPESFAPGVCYTACRAQAEPDLIDRARRKKMLSRADEAWLASLAKELKAH